MMMLKKAKYCELRGALSRYNVRITTIAKLIEKSSTYMHERFNGKASFTIDDGYKILDFLGISHEEFVTYFPPGGFA